MQTLIRKLDSLSPLPKEDKSLLREVASRTRKVDARTDIIKEGDDPSDVHLIDSGFACRYKILGNGKRQIVAYLLPGDLCDLHVFILNAMDHSIATISECEVTSIPRSSILELLERPALAKALLLATLVDEATLREWVTNVGQRRAEIRIAHLFCELHARLNAVGLYQSGSFKLPVTQVELGDTAGLSVVHVNRSLQQLRERGLIALRSGVLSIPDIYRLAEISGFRPNYLHLAGDNAPGDQETTALDPSSNPATMTQESAGVPDAYCLAGIAELS